VALPASRPLGVIYAGSNFDHSRLLIHHKVRILQLSHLYLHNVLYQVVHLSLVARYLVNINNLVVLQILQKLAEVVLDEIVSHNVFLMVVSSTVVPTEFNVLGKLVDKLSPLLMANLLSFHYGRLRRARQRARRLLILLVLLPYVRLPFRPFQAICHQGGLVLLLKEAVLEFHDKIFVHPRILNGLNILLLEI